MGTYVGSRAFRLHDDGSDLAFPVWVMYPTREPSSLVMIGPYPVDISTNAAPADGRFPLVVISHGRGGSHLVYRTIAAYLARRGYIVAMPEHPGDNRNNSELSGSTENLEGRPRHVSMAIDAVAADALLGPAVDTSRVAVIGHSMGGYTALAVAGGQPLSESGKKVAVKSDARVKALVLLAPATGWYAHEGSLSDVKVPILMLAAEHDLHTPRCQSDLVLAGVPDSSRVEYRVIDGAGHFSFLSPFPPSMRSPGFAPSTDPDGFDRARFHEALNPQLHEFLRTALG